METSTEVSIKQGSRCETNEVRKKDSCHEVNEVRRDRKRRSSGMNELSYTCGSDLYGTCERRHKGALRGMRTI